MDFREFGNHDEKHGHKEENSVSHSTYAREVTLIKREQSSKTQFIEKKQTLRESQVLHLVHQNILDTGHLMEILCSWMTKARNYRMMADYNW